jgi:hypothetical protein
MTGSMAMWSRPGRGVLAILLSVALLFTLHIVIPPEVSPIQQVMGQSDGGSGGDVPLNRYYLYTEYVEAYDFTKYKFVPYVPGEDAGNKALLDNGTSELTFTHNILGRRADTGFVPELVLWVNSNSQAGKVLEFTMRFDADLDGTFETTYRFGPYTTKLTNDAEQVILTPSSTEGAPRDMSQENGGKFEFNVARSDDQTESLLLYCGAHGHASFVDTPYREVLSISDGDDGDGDGDGGGPDSDLYHVAAVAVLLVAVGAVIWLTRRGPPPSARSGRTGREDRDAGGRDDGDDTDRRRSRSGRRRKKGRRSRSRRRRKLRREE